MIRQSNKEQLKYSNNAFEILKGFSFPPLELSRTEKLEWQDIFFDSIITEYDARRLYWHIDAKNPDLTIELEDTLKPWLRDEIDHAYGFSLIYSAYTGLPLDEIALDVETRKSDFSSLDAFISDPFKLLILFAYDEIITTHVYHRSIKKYDYFKSPQLSTWIRKAKKDETKHFFLFIEKIKLMYSHRLPEAPSVLKHLFKLDFEKRDYTGTFVLDHNTIDYPISQTEIEKTIIPTIIKKLNTTT
ncbi:ferritin-like domain-containing protein [Pseudomonas sp. CHM02]|uniref:ferritin-like domain-containing protein n=1 Tax=Pseudomonas sp. CHM02 TaxID=1463662 RepID=UPI0004717016|nr:ferritin-like domain-containing protein [Pseudomonas sp. CHM02]